MKSVAIIGIQGLPANYGGFESLVENMLGENSSGDVSYTIFCSASDMKSDALTEYKGAKLEYIYCPSHGINSIRYYTKSLIKAGNRFDTVLILGLAGGLYLPIFKLKAKSRIIVNVDGIERKRAKWGGLARLVLYILEKLSVIFADVLISDNEGIRQFLMDEYKKDSVMIAYGGDHVLRNIDDTFSAQLLEKYNLKNSTYAIAVCRIEPENNCHLILDAFSASDAKLVYIGNWDRSNYGKDLKSRFSNCKNILMLNPIYDLDTLYILRANASMYIHGHSVGGTNPSLVEAMFFGIPILSYDVIFNRETTNNRAYYFRDKNELLQLITQPDLNGKGMLEIAKAKYTWGFIVDQYERLY